MNEPMQNLLKLQKLEFGAGQGEDAAKTIAALRSKIPPQILGHYDRLRVRGKKGMAAVVNQVCTGCHMKLPLGVVMTIKHGQDIQLCDSCGRYLYLPSESAELPAIEPQGSKPAKVQRGRKKLAATT
jgi:hypothetical protein